MPKFVANFIGGLPGKVKVKPALLVICGKVVSHHF